MCLREEENGTNWCQCCICVCEFVKNLSSKFIFVRSTQIFSCWFWWDNLTPFEHGWSYRKNSNAGKFVFSYWFIHKIFRLVRGPVFCPVSSFCTSDGPIEKIPMQANLYSHTGSSITISGWSGSGFLSDFRFLYFWWSYRNFFM